MPRSAYIVLLALMSRSTAAQQLVLGPACDPYEPPKHEAESVLKLAAPTVPPSASVSEVCRTSEWAQVRAGVIVEKNEYRYTFSWPTGANVGTLDRWESAICKRDAAGKVSCAPGRSGLRNGAGPWIEVRGEPSDAETIEVLNFMEHNLGEPDVRFIAKEAQTGPIDWSLQNRTYYVRVRKDDWLAQYTLTRTCDFTTACRWKTEGPTGAPIP